LGGLPGAAGVRGDGAICRPSTIRARVNRKVRARNELGLFQRWRLAHLEQAALHSLRQYKTVYDIHRQLSDAGISTDALPAHPDSTSGQSVDSILAVAEADAVKRTQQARAYAAKIGLDIGELDLGQ
jgi:hypothetical protein